MNLNFTYKFNSNLLVAFAALFVVGALTYNQIADTGRIDVMEIAKSAVAILLALNGLIAHRFTPGGAVITDNSNRKINNDNDNINNVASGGGSTEPLPPSNIE